MRKPAAPRKLCEHASLAGFRKLNNDVQNDTADVAGRGCVPLTNGSPWLAGVAALMSQRLGEGVSHAGGGTKTGLRESGRDGRQ